MENYDIKIIFINDGSNDKTESLIYEFANQDSLLIPLSFMRNFGKEAELMAGLTYSTGDTIIPMDGDLQDSLEVIPQLIKEWQNGADIILSKRIDRST